MYRFKNHIYNKLIVVKVNSSNVPRSKIVERDTGVTEDYIINN